MVEISKPLFEATCKDVDCHLLLHYYNPSCWKSIPTTAYHSTVGSAKFYSIVYLEIIAIAMLGWRVGNRNMIAQCAAGCCVYPFGLESLIIKPSGRMAQILMRGKKMRKKEEWVKMGEYYIRSTLLGAGVSTTTSMIGCIFRWLSGNKFSYHTYLLVPNMINGLFIYLEPPSRRGLVINLFANLVIEYWLRTLERDGYLSITRSRSKQTFLFMLGSSLLFYLMRLEGDKEKRTPLFWLYTPEKVRWKSDVSTNVCPHEGSCQRHILKGYSTYFAIGLAITMARQILPKISTPLKALSSIRGKHFKMALFFGSYIGIYRAVICYLSRKRGFDSALHALPAGYLAGLSFAFSPSLGISIASLTAAFKLYSTILYEKKVLPDNIPLPELLYCFCQGTLFHARYMHPDVCPGYVFNLMKTVSNGVSEVLHGNLLKAVKMVP